MLRMILAFTLFTALPSTAHAADNGVLGRWTEPTGSTIEIQRCPEGICARLVGISKQAPTQVDSKNPSPALRARSLCGLQIGSHFRLTDANHAEGGALYDPKTGKTYSGSLTSTGDTLKLRGYIGLKMFGRSETWTRAKSAPATCHS